MTLRPGQWPTLQLSEPQVPGMSSVMDGGAILGQPLPLFCSSLVVCPVSQGVDTPVQMYV